MSEPQPFVSVCLLTYKRADVLGRSLDSLLAQTHTNFELIINDDKSPDETERIGRDYERRDSRVRYFKNAKNLRYAGNQNAAVDRARSEFVAIVHDGDIYRRDLIECWVKALVTHPTAALVFNSVEVMDLCGRTVVVDRQSYAPLIPGLQLLEEMLQSPGSPIFGIVMLRKSCLQAVGPFDTTLPTLADVDMWMRLLARYDAAYISEPLLKVAAREINHHNRPNNWAVRAEHERIYQLNLARSEGRNCPATAARHRRVARMLWRLRVWSILWCAKELKLKSFLAGLRFCCRGPLTSAGASSGIIKQ